MSLILGLALAATAPAADPIATLDELARTEELMVASGDRPRDRRKVLEIEVRTCTIAFKTQIDARGFTARMIDIGDDATIKRAGRHTIRLRGPTRYPDVSVLVSGGDTKRLFDALKGAREACGKAQEIF